MAEGTSILLPPEAESIVDSLEPILPIHMGCVSWVTQHCHIEKLNMQAVASASQNRDEFIKDFLISAGKIQMLISDLLSIEVWKEKIFPEICCLPALLEKPLFPLYMILYHEATVLNLLETVLFHQESCEAAEEAIIDLVDYCSRKLRNQVARTMVEPIEEVDIQEDDFDPVLALTTHSLPLDFNISMKVISIVRYLSDHYKSLAPYVLHRLLVTHDFPLMLIELLESPPWIMQKKHQLLKYIDGKWRRVSVEDRFILSKIEGQIWITLFHLLLEPECQKKYEITDQRKTKILKLRAYLHDVTLDQMPCLSELRRYVEHLSIINPASPSSSHNLIMEQTAEIREVMLKNVLGLERETACHQMHNIYCDELLLQHAQMMSEAYKFENLGQFLNDEGHPCVACGELAKKRCSKCHVEWYCSRPCQVKHWPKHKASCDLYNKSMEELD